MILTLEGMKNADLKKEFDDLHHLLQIPDRDPGKEIVWVWGKVSRRDD